MISRAVVLATLAATALLPPSCLAQTEASTRQQVAGVRESDATSIRSQQRQRQSGLDKPAWEWTNDERIGERLNPQWQEERRQRANAGGDDLPEGVSVISGSLEPELLFPEELFDMFASEVLADDPRVRAAFRTEISNSYSGELPEGFWTDFEAVASELKKISQGGKQIGRDAATAVDTERDRALIRLDKVRSQKCTVFKETLRRSRALLPPGEFDRLLYEGVAPNLTIQEDTSTNSLLDRVERGC